MWLRLGRPSFEAPPHLITPCYTYSESLGVAGGRSRSGWWCGRGWSRCHYRAGRPSLYREARQQQGWRGRAFRWRRRCYWFRLRRRWRGWRGWVRPAPGSGGALSFARPGGRARNRWAFGMGKGEPRASRRSGSGAWSTNNSGPFGRGPFGASTAFRRTSTRRRSGPSSPCGSAPRSGGRANGLRSAGLTPSFSRRGSR